MLTGNYTKPRQRLKKSVGNGDEDMRTYNIYKKRDGQEFKKWSEIYASSFDEAKKIFAHNMTKDNHEKSNNIQWVEGLDGVENGFYDFNCSIISWLNDDCDEIDVENSKLEVFCLQEDILNGFDYWNEDVYTWELRPLYIVQDREAGNEIDFFYSQEDAEEFVQLSEEEDKENDGFVPNFYEIIEG